MAITLKYFKFWPASMAVRVALREVNQQQALQVNEVEMLNLEGNNARLRVKASADVRPAIIRALVAAQVDVLEVKRSHGRLEDIFMKFTQKEGAA